MEQVLLAREYIKVFFSRYEGYIVAVLKFLLCFTVLTLINREMGYMKRLDNTSIVLIVSLLCSFLPANLIIFFAAIFAVLHTYALSLECAVVIGALFLLLFLLYYRYSPRDAVAVLMTPIAFILKVPYSMPIIYGMVGTPLSALSVACGVIVYYMIKYINSISEVISGMGEETTVVRFKFVVDGILHNREMIVMVAAFAVSLIVVNLIKRLSVPYAWWIAIGMGAFADIVAVVVVASRLDVSVKTGGVILGNIIAVLVASVVKFFVFSVDYTRTERVQFEDDEYYYYVKAVPKNTMNIGAFAEDGGLDRPKQGKPRRPKPRERQE